MAPTTTQVSFSNLEDALEWVSVDLAPEHEAFVSRSTGEVFCTGGDWRDEDHPPPADIGDEALYAAMPNKKDFDLGQRLVLRFIEDMLPAEVDNVRGYFRQRGAYRRFKSLLEQRGLTDQWHAFQTEAVKAALRAWCEENGLVMTD